MERDVGSEQQELNSVFSSISLKVRQHNQFIRTLNFGQLNLGGPPKVSCPKKHRLREGRPGQLLILGKYNNGRREKWFDRYKGCTIVKGNTFSPLSIHISTSSFS